LFGLFFFSWSLLMGLIAVVAAFALIAAR